MTENLDSHVKAYQRESLYDFDNELQLKWYPKRVIEKTKGSKSLLELGLGHGITTDIFNPHFERHVVIDASTAVIENFRQRYPDCTPEIVQTFFEDYHTDEQFDVMVFGYILEHVDDPVRILKHFIPNIKTEGSVFATVPNAEVLNRRLGHLAGMLPDMTELSAHDHLLGHQRYYTVETFAEDICAAGYEVVKMEGIYLKPLTTSQMISLNFDEKIMEAFCKVAIDYPELSCGLMAEIRPINKD